MIDRIEIGHRDRILRAYFEGRAWDGNEEFTLKRELVLKSYDILPMYPFLIDSDWEVHPNMAQAGQGDLIFTDGAECFAVVEVKWLDMVSTGSTASTRRTQKRKKVKQQATLYGEVLASKLPRTAKVTSYYFTNEDTSKVFNVKG
jgi:hypothetical protein